MGGAERGLGWGGLEVQLACGGGQVRWGRGVEEEMKGVSTGLLIVLGHR